MDFPLLVKILLLGPLVGCASLDESPDRGSGGAGGSNANVVPVACTNNLTEEIAILDWELIVSPSPLPIESDMLFTATLDGVAVFDEGVLNGVQTRVPGGVRELDLVDISATVRVRAGATGDDVILMMGEVDYECRDGGAACDPEHDLPSVPGRSENTDCQPQNVSNSCGRFFPIPISDDCSLDGDCADLGRTGPGSPCARNGFCVEAGVRFELKRAANDYTSDSQGHVLFGWAEDVTMLEDETLNLPAADYGKEVGPIGLRVVLDSVTVALECAMGVRRSDGLPSPAPPSALISFAIQAP